MTVVEQQPFSVNAALARILSRSNNYLTSFPQPTRSASSPTCEVHVDLPEPPSLLPHLVAAGARLELAQAMHAAYYRRACEFREHSLAALSRTCSRLAQIPSCSGSSEQTVITTFTQLYLKNLDLWIREGVSMFQCKESSTISCWNNGETVASKTSRSFNHQYVPLLEHFFEENPFPTHADKVFLAKKSDMTYRQIHVWFQNRRNRTKRVLHRKPVSEGATLPLDTLIQKMGKFAVPPTHNPDSPSSEQTAPSPHAEVRNVLEGVAPPHAFPAPYRSTCAYDPFPNVPVFIAPEWPRRTVPSSEWPSKCVADVDELIGTFSRLNVWDDSFSRSRRQAGKAPGDCYAAVSAITIKPSSAPHPACIRKPIDAPVPRTTFQSIRATTSSSRVFGSPSPQSPMATLIPKATRRKLAPLPKRPPHNPPFTHHRETFGNSASSRSSSSSSRSSSFSSQGSFQDANFTFSSPSNSSSASTTPEISPSPLTLPGDGLDDPLFT